MKVSLPSLSTKSLSYEDRVKMISTFKAQRHMYSDYQARRLYNAENDVENMDDILSLEQATDFVRHIQRSDWMEENYPRYYSTEPTKVTIGIPYVDRLAGAMARTNLLSGDIEIPEVVGVTKHSLLHEVAHAVSYAHYGFTRMINCIQGHGPEFAKINLEIFQQFMSPDYADRMKEEYRRNKVDFTSEPWKDCDASL